MKKNQTKEQYKEWINKIAEKNRNNPNHSEQAFIDILDYYNIKYTFEKPVIYNDKDGYYGYIFDFYIIIDDKEFDIEVDGISHTDEDAKLKDQKRDMLAKDCNIKVIRLDSYFVLYLRNVFKKKFTKESFLKWIINECPINLKKDRDNLAAEIFKKFIAEDESKARQKQINELKEQTKILTARMDNFERDLKTTINIMGRLQEQTDELEEQINQLKER